MPAAESNLPRPMVDIAMATYNGAAHLDEMLTSIASQSEQDIRLIVADDGSSDGTNAVIGIHEAALRIVRAEKETSHTGILRNFEAALTRCEANYIVLCDQDDIWVKNKIEVMLAHIKRVETAYGADAPILVFSDLAIVDQKGAIISESFFRSSIKSPQITGFRDLFIGNHVPGCAMMFNRALLDKALPFPNVTIHDWWLIQVASLFGRVEFVDQPLIQYRQHQGNAIGLGKSARTFLPISQVAKRLTMWRARANAIRLNSKAIKARFSTELPAVAEQLVNHGSYSYSPWALHRQLKGANLGERFADYLGILFMLARQ